MKKNNAVVQYNALDGKKVTRKTLEKLRDLAVNQLQRHVVAEINEFLLKNPKPFITIFEPEYTIDIPKKLEWKPTGTGLGAARHSGLAKEALSDCGRLKPGYQYKKGGTIVKVEKKKKKKAAPTQKKKDVSGNIDKNKGASEKLYDFIYEVSVGRPGKYVIKTWHKLTPNRGLKDLGGFSSIQGLNRYLATENGLKALKKQFKDNVYGDKSAIGWKKLKKIKPVENSSKKIPPKKTVESKNKSTPKTTAKKKNTSFKKQKNQLGLFGSKSKTKKRRSTTVKKKGLGNPIILDAGKPYAPVSGLGVADSNRDATANAMAMEVRQPQTVVPSVPVKKEVTANTRKSSKYKTAYESLNEKGSQNPSYQITGDLRKFLGDIEIKPIQSLAVTIDTEEGGGKTHTIFDWADKFATAGYRPIIWSLEEHESSNVSKDKKRKYFSPRNQHIIAVESERENESKEALLNRIMESFADFDVIFIDSWAKLKKLKSTLEFDADIRKKYNGKLFIVIFQRTSDGKMRGGSDSAFDGDIIIKGEVDRGNYKNNFLYNHKNRYNAYSPMSDLKWSGFLRGLKPLENESIPQNSYPQIGVIRL